MKTEFELPDVGEGVAEGELVSWHVDVGDTVEEDQVLAEVETDKALVEIPSPHDGEIVDLRAEAGEMVPVGDVLVVFEVDGTSSAEPATSDEARGTDTASSESPETATTAADDETNAADAPAASGGETVSDGRVFAPPSVRRLAREVGVDIASLPATDAGDRVSERDVREAARGVTDDSPASEPAASSDTGDLESDAGVATGGLESPAPEPDAATPEPSQPAAVDRNGGAAGAVAGSDGADRDRTLAMPATRRLAREEGVSLDAVPASERRDGKAFVTPDDVRAYATSDGAASEATAGTAATAGSATNTTPSSSRASATEVPGGPGPGDRVPYTGVRRTIGDQMATSKYTAPHVSHHDEVEVSELVDARTRLKERADERGVKLTYLPFAVKAVVAALKEVPAINAELDEDEDEIVLHDEYNIGIAVASDAGLMVPVIDDADRKGLLELAREINDKAERARDRSIGLEEMQGGTFTITNVGAIGGEYASPIINYPEAGILALGSMKERPWVDDGEVVARPTMPISMSVDHRIVDGAEAAQFTNEVKRYLNAPELLLLE
ncbi:2-oxo acid dehydrogenase subunit E2 [Natronorubrum sp. FCH18a]|uniref:2-oxo acid dehydrogenase subunit E2 n=1 Tax=Natronorubrum sp. FCH18a TaxID=3447018 RepID=UPI003F515BB8